MPNPATGISAGASVLGGSIASRGASKAASTQAAAADRAAALQKQMFDLQMAGQEPYRQAGLTGQNRLMELLGLRAPAQSGVGGAPYMRTDAELRNALAGQFTSAGSPGGYFGGGMEGDGSYVAAMPGEINEAGLAAAMAAARQGDQNALSNYQPPQGAGQSADFGKYARDFNMSDFQQDPGYAFRLSEGQKALDRQAAARGGLISGGALKAAQGYGQNMASQEYMNAFNRYQTNRSNQLNPLGSLMTLGQNAAANQGASMGTYGTNVGNTYMSAGNAMAAGQLGSANTLAGGLQAGASAYRNQMNFTDYLNRFRNQSDGETTIPFYGPQ